MTNLLGLDTSTAASAAAVLRADGAGFEVLPGPARLQAPPAHARELMPAVAEVNAVESGSGDEVRVVIEHQPELPRSGATHYIGVAKNLGFAVLLVAVLQDLDAGFCEAADQLSQHLTP